MKPAIYIYPDTDKATNDYINKFHNSFQINGYKLNNRLPKLRLLNLLFNLDSDIFFVNWVDVLPFLRFGKLQCLFLYCMIRIIKLLNKEIIWILHNKKSHRHDSEKVEIVEKVMNYMAKYSDKIIVHAEEGVTFYNQRYSHLYGNKAFYIPHPVYSESIINTCSTCEWDFIIWGKIEKYKNVYEFLKFCQKSTFFYDKKVLICGQCDDRDYERLIIENLGENMRFINQFLIDEELQTMITRSEMILFTYASDTVLSSGALIYSLNFAKPIIAPRVGNFKDYPNYVNCYNTFDDIEDNLKDMRIESISIRKEFLKANSWIIFPEKVLNIR